MGRTVHLCYALPFSPVSAVHFNETSGRAPFYRAAVEALARRPVEPDEVDEVLNGQSRIVYMNIPTTLRLNQVKNATSIILCTVVTGVGFFRSTSSGSAGWANFVVHTLLPYLALIVLNLLILRRLSSFARQASPKQAAASGAQAANGGGAGEGAKKKDVLLAKISLVIVFVFIVCHSVRWVPNVYELYLVSARTMR